MILARMFCRFPLAFVLALILAVPLAGGMPSNSDSTNRLLVIERSSTRVSAARATLTIEPLVRTNQIFAGNYDVKVSPFFFKSESGKLEINVPDESLAKATNGVPVQITGTALTNGEKVKRKVNAIATPIDKTQGKLKVWFLADEREMVFQTTYRLVER
jgi:hypothetical protein